MIIHTGLQWRLNEITHAQWKLGMALSSVNNGLGKEKKKSLVWYYSSLTLHALLQSSFLYPTMFNINL